MPSKDDDASEDRKKEQKKEKKPSKDDDRDDRKSDRKKSKKSSKKRSKSRRRSESSSSSEEERSRSRRRRKRSSSPIAAPNRHKTSGNMAGATAMTPHAVAEDSKLPTLTEIMKEHPTMSLQQALIMLQSLKQQQSDAPATSGTTSASALTAMETILSTPPSCCFFLQGNCMHGGMCELSHTQGDRCQFGERCRFGHATKAEFSSLMSYLSDNKKDGDPAVVAQQQQQQEQLPPFGIPAEAFAPAVVRSAAHNLPPSRPVA